MTDKAIGWVSQQKALMGDKPFFMYFAPGATHAPHHVPKEWIDKFKGKFDQGWDKVREETFARQKKLGVIPADAVLTKRPDEIPAYKDMPADHEADSRARDGGLCRVPRAYRSSCRSADRQAGRAGDPRQHADLLHLRRQRRLRRRHAERLFQRSRRAERHGQASRRPNS